MMGKSSIRILTLSLLVCACQELCLGQTWKPTAAAIEKLEASINPSDFPKWAYGDHPPHLSEYARYYLAKMQNNHRILSGEFVRREIAQKAAGVYLVMSEKDFPMIYDGGCSIVHIVYDVDASHLISLTCNGRA